MTLAPRSVGGVTTLQLLAFLPPLLVIGLAAPKAVGSILAVAAITVLVWEMAFAGLRKRAFSAHGMTTALVATLFCPVDIALWQLAFVLSLGVTFGELIFGGRGFGIVSPGALALALLVVSFPGTALHATTPQVAAAVLPGLLLLLLAGLVSISILVGTAIAAITTLFATGQVVEPTVIFAALSVGTVFLIADPTAACITAIGRWLYGFLAGMLVVIFSPLGALTSEAIVAAALFASVFAPLIDHGVVLLHMRTRRRHG